MKNKIIKLNERELINLVKKIINEVYSYENIEDFDWGSTINRLMAENSVDVAAIKLVDEYMELTYGVTLSENEVVDNSEDFDDIVVSLNEGDIDRVIDIVKALCAIITQPGVKSSKVDYDLYADSNDSSDDIEFGRNLRTGKIKYKNPSKDYKDDDFDKIVKMNDNNDYKIKFDKIYDKMGYKEKIDKMNRNSLPLNKKASDELEREKESEEIKKELLKKRKGNMSNKEYYDKKFKKY